MSVPQQEFLMRLFQKLLPFVVLILLAGTLVAQSAPVATPGPNDGAAQADRIAQLQQQIADAKGSADNSWMLVSAALVLMMTGPGLALFYGGLVRKKNVLSTMMQSFAMMAVITVLWGIVAYSLCFASGNSFLGGFSHLFLRGVGAQPDADYAATIPQQTFMIYQLMFAIIGGRFPTLDFAGGTVVHITSGVSALICATYLGRRLGYPTEPMPPHSVVLSFIGACLLWVGWFGFNAGSALSAGSLATSAFVATHFAAASAAIGWAGAEWIRNGKPSALGAISGCVAGLVAITPAAGFVGPMPALLIGLIAGVSCYLMVAAVKARLGYDDSLDAFGVHGVGGTIGALLTGVFATKLVNPIFKDGQGSTLAVGVIDGNYHQMLNQMVGIAMAIVLAVVGTYIILRVVDFVVGVRVSAEHEEQGLDVTQHGEEGYSWEFSLP